MPLHVPRPAADPGRGMGGRQKEGRGASEVNSVLEFVIVVVVLW